MKVEPEFVAPRVKLPTKRDLADALTAAREKAGLTQPELGERLNVARQQVGLWENADRVPEPEQLQLFALACGLPAHHFATLHTAIAWRTASFVGAQSYEDEEPAAFEGTATEIAQRMDGYRNNVEQRVTPELAKAAYEAALPRVRFDARKIKRAASWADLRGTKGRRG